MLEEISLRLDAGAIARDYAARAAVVISQSGQMSEGIDTGLSGALLLLIEMYRQTGDERYAIMVRQKASDLVKHCDAAPTRDYSLYTGRAGVVYVLLQWHFLSGEYLLLEECLQLMGPATEDYLSSDYTSDYLFNGRAGTLLTLVHLYLTTGEEKLVDDIRRFLFKLLSGARWTADGLCWADKDELYLRPSCGFAHGAAGIRYVLHQLFPYIDASGMGVTFAEIDRYLGSCWVEPLHNWGNYERDIRDKETLSAYQSRYRDGDPSLFTPADTPGWASGTAGLLCSGAGDRAARDTARKKLYRTAQSGMWTSKNLYEGLSGMGLALATRMPAEDQVLNNLTVHLADVVQRMPAVHSSAGGLLHGEWGLLYFLLKATGSIENVENILIPFQGREPAADMTPIKDAVAATDIHKAWIGQYYPRITRLIETSAPFIQPEIFNGTVRELEQEIMVFNRTIRQAAEDLLPANAQACLMDLHQLETAKTRYILASRRPALQTFLDDWALQEEMLERMNEEGEWLLNISAVISPGIKVLSSAWDWSFSNDFGNIRDNQAENLGKSPGMYYYIVQISGKDEVVEFGLKQDTLMLLELFKTPRPVRQALSAIKQYIRALPEQTLRELLISLSESRNVRDFIEQSDNIALFKIRQWLCRGILSIA